MILYLVDSNGAIILWEQLWIQDEIASEWDWDVPVQNALKMTWTGNSTWPNPPAPCRCPWVALSPCIGSTPVQTPLFDLWAPPSDEAGLPKDYNLRVDTDGTSVLRLPPYLRFSSLWFSEFSLFLVVPCHIANAPWGRHIKTLLATNILV